MRRLLTATLLAAICTRGGIAQTVRGSVVDAAERPVPGVIVLLVDARAREVVRTLSNERGEYRIVAPGEGTFRLRTLRIGYRASTTEPFAIALGQDIQRRLALSTIVFALDTVRATDRNTCRVVAADSTSTMFGAWEQVRNALLATQLSGGSRTIIATTMGYTQMLDAVKLRVGEQSSDVRADFLRQPWRSLTADSLRRAGYVVTEAGDVRTYYAPGIDVLLSEQFLTDHCLRVASGSNERRLGIAFQPTPDRGKIAEIRGTLWLDRNTSELQRLEYKYVNVSEDEERNSGGEMSFIRIRNGMWAISRWNIRMPTIVLVPVYDQRLRVVAHEQRVDSIKVTGGELVAVVSPEGGRRDTLWTRPAIILAGVVIDSITGRALPNAIVSIAATRHADTTDGNGRFAIADMLPGRYTLDLRTPSLDSARMTHQAQILFTDSSASIRVRVPSAGQIAEAVCPNLPRNSRTGIIVGSVAVTGDTAPRANVMIGATWQVVQVGRSQVVKMTQGAAAHTDASGTYRLCGVPTLTDLTIQAIVDSATQGFKTVKLPDSQRFGRLDFTIDPAAATPIPIPIPIPIGSSSFTGSVVTDSTNLPIADADVQISDVGLSARTDARGMFRIAGVLPGTHTVVVRRVGYGAMEAKLDFLAGQPTDRKIVLARITVLDSLVSNARSFRDPNMDEFEERRRIGRGHFVTRADLAKREGMSTGTFLQQMPNVNIATAVGGDYALGRGPRCNARPPTTYPTNPGELCEIYYLPSASEHNMGVPIGCFSRVYIDNALANPGTPTPPYNLRDMPPTQLEAIELYARSSEVPPKYAHLNSGCGVIVLHTRRPK